MNHPMNLLARKTFFAALSGWLLLAAAPALANDLTTLQRQAENGRADAQAELGLVYERGREGVVPNFAMALDWYGKAAAQGHAEGEYGMGHVYYYGLGVPQDYARSADWFERAAKQGHAWAQYYLALIYAHGRGIEQDEKQAAIWFSRAAKQGHAGARSNFLAFRYDRKWRNQDGSLWKPDQ